MIWNVVHLIVFTYQGELKVYTVFLMIVFSWRTDFYIARLGVPYYLLGIVGHHFDMYKRILKVKDLSLNLSIYNSTYFM